MARINKSDLSLTLAEHLRMNEALILYKHKLEAEIVRYQSMERRREFQEVLETDLKTVNGLIRLFDRLHTQAAIMRGSVG